MKAKLLRKIRSRFEIIYLWDNEDKESVFLSKNKKTGKVFKCNKFERLYFYICWAWGYSTYWKLKELWFIRSQNRNQRKLINMFNMNKTK